MPINSGQLRHRLILHRVLEVRDEFGASTETLIREGVYWCSTMNTDNETVGGTIRTTQNTLKLVTRYNKTLEEVTNSDVIEFRGKFYEITSVLNPKMLNERLEIECVLKGAGGEDCQ